MTIRRTEMCNSIANGTVCDHYKTSRGCGFAHSTAEIAAVEAERKRFVQERLDSHGWPWYRYHRDNRFKGC
eukprot:11565785-Heterocapsa_arctica.AAC.1